MVPVHQEDFKKFNEFAEAAWICRDLENADRIKEIRKTLLKEVCKISLKGESSIKISNIAAQPGSTESHRREKEKNLTINRHPIILIIKYNSYNTHKNVCAIS